MLVHVGRGRLLASVVGLGESDWWWFVVIVSVGDSENRSVNGGRIAMTEWCYGWSGLRAPPW